MSHDLSPQANQTGQVVQVPDATQQPPQMRRPLLQRVFAILLITAATLSVLSALAFAAYLLLPHIAGAGQPSDHTFLYAVGVVGLLAAEGCQLLGIALLIVQWFSRTNTPKRPREIVVLVLSLVPYMVVLIFLVTLIVYLRARRLNPTSERTQESAQELKEQVVDTIIDIGANTTNSAAGASASAVATTPSAMQSFTAPQVSPQPTPTVQLPTQSTAKWAVRQAVSRVVGPSTAKSMSEVANGALAFTLVGLLLATIATVGVVLPSGFLAPLQSGGGTVAARPGLSPLALAGAWKLTMSYTTVTCTANPPSGCSSQSGNPGSISTQVTIQQSGAHLVMLFPSTPTAGGANGNGTAFGFTGTIAGHKVSFSYVFSGPNTDQFGNTVDLTVSEHLTGSVLGSNQMSGTFNFTGYANGVPHGLQFTQSTKGGGNWIATRITP